MLVIKALHISLVVSWFAGLFYLPRIFVNLAMVPPESTAEVIGLAASLGARSGQARFGKLAICKA